DTPAQAALPSGAWQGLGPLGCLESQHHAAWGGPRAGARLAPAVGKPRCSRIARTPRDPFTYAKTRRLPPHLTQANTSNAKLRRRSPAQSRGGVRLLCGSSRPGANDGFPSLEVGGRRVAPRVQAEPLAPQRDVVICPPGHPLARRRRFPLAALAP